MFVWSLLEPTHIDLHKSRTLARRVAELQTLRWAPPSMTETTASPGSEPETYSNPLDFLREFRRLQQLRNVPAGALFDVRDFQAPEQPVSAPALFEVGDAQERELLSALSEPPPNSAQSGSVVDGERGAEGPQPEVFVGNSDELEDDLDRSFAERTGFLPPIEASSEQTSNSIVRAMAARASAQAIATARSEHSEGAPRSARPASRSSASGAAGAILNVTIALSPNNSSRRQSHRTPTRTPTPNANKAALLGNSSRVSPLPGASGSARVSFAVTGSPSPHANGLSPVGTRLRSSSQNVRSPAASSVRSQRGASSELVDSVGSASALTHSPAPAATHSRSARGSVTVGGTNQTKQSNRSSITETPAKTAPQADQTSVVSALLIPHFNSDLTEEAIASLPKLLDQNEEL